MKILMTGATGLIGKSLGQRLVNEGHTLRVVSRNKKKAKQELPFPAEVIECDLMTSALKAEDFKDIQAVIHLLGETIDGRWTTKKKQAILDSRKISSENLLRYLPSEIEVVVSASAQGIYGDRLDEVLTEESSPGDGFLAEVCKEWEIPFLTLKNERKKTRFVTLRIGVVLSSRGGALHKLITLFQKNLGAVLASGQQWMSWISLRDLIEVFYQAVNNSKYEGVINAAQPVPVRNSHFTQLLCETLNVVQLPAIPSFVLKSLLGEMSTLVLQSQRVNCAKLKELQFSFQDMDLKSYFELELSDFKNGQQVFYAEQFVEADINHVFNFFADAKNLEKITPATLKFNIDKMSTVAIEQGTLIDYKLKIHGVPAKWKTRIEQWNPPEKFVDIQLNGPYQKWHHIHSFKSLANGTLMTDTVKYKLPLGSIGNLIAGSFVESDVDQIFRFRRQVIADLKF